MGKVSFPWDVVRPGVEPGERLSRLEGFGQGAESQLIKRHARGAVNHRGKGRPAVGRDRKKFVVFPRRDECIERAPAVADELSHSLPKLGIEDGNDQNPRAGEKVTSILEPQFLKARKGPEIAAMHGGQGRQGHPGIVAAATLHQDVGRWQPTTTVENSGLKGATATHSRGFRYRGFVDGRFRDVGAEMKAQPIGLEFGSFKETQDFRKLLGIQAKLSRSIRILGIHLGCRMKPDAELPGLFSGEGSQRFGLGKGVEMDANTRTCGAGEPSMLGGTIDENGAGIEALGEGRLEFEFADDLNGSPLLLPPA